MKVSTQLLLIMLLPPKTGYDTIPHRLCWQDVARVPVRSLGFLFPSFHCVPVLNTSNRDLERLPKMSPKISTLYSVSSLRSVITAVLSSPPSTSSRGWSKPSAWLTIMTKVSKESSSAIQESWKLLWETLETTRACTSGSNSGWHGQKSVLLLCLGLQSWKGRFSATTQKK